MSMTMKQLPTRRVIREETDYPQNPKAGDLLVTHHFGKNGILYQHKYAVETPEEASALIAHLRRSQVNDARVVRSYFGMEVFEPDPDPDGISPGMFDSQWVEWTNDDGDNIQVAMTPEDA